MSLSPDFRASQKVQPWIPLDLGLPNHGPQPAAPFFGLEPLALCEAGAPAQERKLAPAASRKPAEAGQTVQAWNPGELHGSYLIPLGASHAELEAIEEQALDEVQRKALHRARLETEEILSAARREAEEIIRDGQAKAGEIAEQARLGGIASGRQEISALLSLANGIVAEVQSWQEAVLRQSEELVLCLVGDIAAKLFGAGFALDPERLEKVFERGLAEAKALGDLRIRAHPEDVAALDELWPARQTAIRGQKIEMVPDQDIQRGGCFIDGQYGSVDGRLETQLMLVSETLSNVQGAGSR